MLLPSCKKINEALDSLDGRLDKLEQEAIPSIDEQIAAINTTLENLDSMDKELKGYIDALTTTASNLQEQINTTNTKIDEVEAALKKELEDSNAENLVQLQTAKAEVLAQLEAAKTELENELAQINATIATLQEKDKELDEKIKDLNDYVNNELTKTTTWVEATFATLEQYNSLVTEIAVIKEQIKATNQSIAALETYLTTKINADIAAAVASLSADIQQKVKEITDAYTDAIKSAKEEITAAYTSAIQTAITTLDNSLKTWVGEQLANYYTIAQIDAMLATMEQEMNGKLEAQKAYLEGLINELSAALTKSIADNKVLIEGLQKDITTLQGTAAEHASRIAQNASTIATNTQNIIDLSKSIYANKEDITANEKAIADNKALIEANAKLIADNAAAIKALQASPDASVVKNAAKIAENAEGIAQNAALISANAVAINNNASAIANNTADILQLQQDLASAKAEITEAYKTAINDAITTNNGVIDAKIAAKVETINTRIDNEVAIINAAIKTLTDRMNVLEEEMEAIQKLVSDFLKEFDEIKETIERILSMIQSVSYVPQYSDGKAVMMVTAGVYDGTVEFDFQLSPKSVVSDIVANWQSILAIKAVYTKTRAVSYVDMPIISCVADGQNGILTIVASGKNLGEEFFKGNQPINAALFISDGNSEVVSDYVEIVPVNTSGEEIIPANEIWYTSVDGEIVAPNSATAFNSVLLSNTYHGDKGILKFDADVTEIQAEAFKGCSDIVSMTLPNTVVTIGGSAFEGSKGLHTILLSESLKEIGTKAFCDCISLRSINIPKGVAEIKESTFSGCKKMLSAMIPNSVLTIGGKAFSGCSSLKEIIIPDSVIEIGGSAFDGCTGDLIIKSRTLIEKDYTSYDYPMYYYYSSSTGTRSGWLYGSKFTTVVIANEVQKIGDYTFYDYSGLTSFTIPNSVTKIGDFAFYNCSGLTSITIPNNVTKIGYYAFKDCSGLTRITIPNSVTEIGYQAFENCSGLTSITIGNGVIKIGNYAFKDCSGLTSITIPNSVTEIGYQAFENCTGELIVQCNMPSNSSFVYAFGASKFTDVTIGDGVEEIGDSTFYGCSSLKSITISNSVTKIGEYAFKGCSGVSGVTIGNSVTEIGSEAFVDCTGTLTINGNVSNEAFKNSGFTKVIFGSSVKSVGNDGFSNCQSIAEVHIADIASWCGITFSNAAANPLHNGSRLFAGGVLVEGNLIIHNGTASIGSYTFYGYDLLTSVSIPNSVTEIGDSAFLYCGALATVYCQSNTPPNLGTKVFDGNASERVIYVPNGTIESYHSATNWKDYKAYIMYEGEQPLKVGDVVTKGGATGVVFSISQSTVKLVSTTETNDKRSSAVSWCNNYGTGWRMPTYSELSSIYSNKAKLNTNLNTKLGTGYYWSSENHGSYSYSVKVLNFTNGVSAYENENKSCYARAVFEF